MGTMFQLQTIMGLVILGTELCLDTPSQKLDRAGHPWLSRLVVGGEALIIVKLTTSRHQMLIGSIKKKCSKCIWLLLGSF